MINLTPAIKELEREIRDRQHRFEEQIRPYKDSLKQLKELNEACEYCLGAGSILRARACAEDDRPDPNDPQDYRTCPYCNGSGRKEDGESTCNMS